MGTSILDELYYGNIQPYAKQFVRNSTFGRLAQAATDNEEKLRQMIDENGISLLDKILNAQGEMQTIVSRESYIEGFRIGMRIAMEALMDGRESDIKDIV